MKIKELEYEKLMASERNFIAQSWKKSYRSSYEFFYMETRLYYERFGPVVDYLMKNSRFLMGYDNSGLILGFSCFDEDCLHYIYLKELERNKKLSKEFIPKGMNFVSHFNKDYKIYIHTRLERIDRLSYDPYRKYGR